MAQLPLTGSFQITGITYGTGCTNVEYAISEASVGISIEEDYIMYPVILDREYTYTLTVTFTGTPYGSVIEEFEVTLVVPPDCEENNILFTFDI